MLQKKHSQQNDQLMVSSLKKHTSQSIVRRAKVKYFSTLARFKRLRHNYRVPLLATVIFLVLIIVFAAIRQFERTSLIGLINQVSTGSGGYANLLSVDEAQQFSKNDTTELEGQDTSQVNQGFDDSDSTQSTSTAFAIDSGAPASSPTGASGSNGSGGSSGTGGTGATRNEPVPAPFSAKIDSLKQVSTSLQCKNPDKPNANNCSKVYSFSASIQTLNGPGSVSYTWQSNNSAGIGSGSFSAGAGSSVTTISKQITLECRTPTDFSLLVVLVLPAPKTSNTINVSHNCNEV